MSECVRCYEKTKPGIKESGRKYYFVLSVQESPANYVMFEQILN